MKDIFISGKIEVDVICLEKTGPGMCVHKRMKLAKSVFFFFFFFFFLQYRPHTFLSDKDT